MRKRLNIDELNAIHMRYDKKLKRQDIMRIVMLPSLYIPTLMFFIFFRWWLIPLGFIIGLCYGLWILLPLVVKSNYQKRALKERNRFVNNFVQSLHRSNVTILDALNEVSNHRLTGELKNDVEVLAYSVATHASHHRKTAYSNLIEKYKGDRIFVQYIEHMITIDLDGSYNLDPLDETASTHDMALEWQETMIRRKKESLLYFVTNNLLAFLLTLAVIWLTWTNHIEWFIRSPVGWIFGGVYLAMTFFYNHRFVVDYHDENIMEVKI